MVAINDLSDLINRQSGGNSGNPNNLYFHKVPRVAGVAATAPIVGRGASLWTYDGMPSGGAVPTAGAIPTRSTTGALPFTVPGGGMDLHLIGASITPVTPGAYLLYDRLFHIGGLSGASTADQTVQGSTPSPALQRAGPGPQAGGAGNIAWYEIYTTIGTTSTTLTMTYTDQDGNTGQTATINIGGTGFREVTRAQRIPLAAGDTGLRAIEKVKLTASTGTAGDFGITIAKPLAWIPVGAAGTAGWRDYTTGLPGIPIINFDACLALMFIPAAATAPEVWGSIATVEK
jgi:hypothetical protein